MSCFMKSILTVVSELANQLFILIHLTTACYYTASHDLFSNDVLVLSFAKGNLHIITRSHLFRFQVKTLTK